MAGSAQLLTGGLMHVSFRRLLAAGAASATLATAAQAGAQDITGAGATFPAPVYTKWAAAAKSAIGISLNYQALGSGAGQNQIIKGTVDFGASDAPMSADKLATNHLMQFPTVMGAVVPIVNIPGIKPDELKLTGTVLADIFSGDIEAWNDPAIKALNPGLKLPHLPIAAVHRADGSGTTFVFTSYLAAESAKWKSNVGASTSVAWPNGAGAKGNDGVAGTVRNTRGGVGYVEFAYAASNHLTTVALKNTDGQFVTATLPAFVAAASHADWTGAKNFAVNLIDMPGATSWPIVSATFVIVPEAPKNPAQETAVLKFFDWGYKSGGSIATGLNYVTLPDAVQASVRDAWSSMIKGPDGQKLTF
jgi:phosphate transport system substrate-binding protein